MILNYILKQNIKNTAFKFLGEFFSNFLSTFMIHKKYNEKSTQNKVINITC